MRGMDASAALTAYRRRIGADGSLNPDLATLRRLHAAHMQAIPFENSSVLFGERISVDPIAAVHKLGLDGRGGFCYELNGAFALLLQDIGYAVDHLDARVYGEASVGPHFDHLALRVALDEPWLVDVGFGYSFAEPLRLSIGLEQSDPMGAFRLVQLDDGLDLEWRHRDGRWVPHYRFGLEAQSLDAFEDRCAELQTASDSPFVEHWICSRIVGGAGVTLMDGRFVDSTGPERVDLRPDDAETITILADRFDIHARRVGGRWVPAARHPV
jgi:N-hydroxyarylamine O-acetyltransferase